jgi:cell division septal protein FtsQ
MNQDRQKNKKKTIRPNRYKQAPKRAQNKVRERKKKNKSGRSAGSVQTGKSLLGGLARFFKVVFSTVFILGALGAVSVGLVLGYYYTINSEYFTVKKVVLQGLNRVTRAEVLAKTGLSKPSNVLASNLKEMGLAVKTIPWVEDVNLKRKMPDTIIIDIKEHRPCSLVNLDGLFYLNEKGQPFKKVDAKEKPGLPIITGFSKEDFLKREVFTQRDLTEVFSLLEVLAERNDRFRLDNISEVNFDPARGISIFTRNDNVQVKVGLGDYRAKMRRLGRVLAHLKIKGKAEGLVYFNLESSPRVIVRHAPKSQGVG